MQNNTMNFKNQSRFFQSPLNVLVIDDNPSDAENMIQILREQGIEVHWVRVEDETGYVQALESPKDIILSKWVLPRFNGATALHLLRSNQSEIPIIFIVADDIDFQKSPEVLQDGAVD
jgi:CheY-like chemotaxis protein